MNNILPVKGQIITMNLGNGTPVAGTNNQYRVLSINGSIAEVVAMYDMSVHQIFDASNNTYNGSDLDIYLNQTFYNLLNATAKSAIVDKTFTQDSWYDGTSGSQVYSGYYGTSNPGTTAYSISLGSTTYGSSITRHVYALSVQDVLDYVLDTSLGDGKLQNHNIWKMFWNTTSQPSNYTYPWLRSALADYSYLAWYVRGYYGYVDYGFVDRNLAARPALTIDLSKIDWQ